MTSSVIASLNSSLLSRPEWMRRQRQARGWSVSEMRRRLREAAREAGDTLPSDECLGVMIRRWEKGVGGVSERYRMHYCRALDIPLASFGTAPIPATGLDRAAPAAPAASAPVSAASAALSSLDDEERAELIRLRRQYDELTARLESLRRDLIGWAYKALQEEGEAI
jgi:transcriptional regulator with XRE-family HTH domain